MSTVKLAFCDVVVELVGSEKTQELTDRAIGLLTFLIQERIKYNSCMPDEEEEDTDICPPETTKNPVLPPEVLKAYR